MSSSIDEEEIEWRRQRDLAEAEDQLTNELTESLAVDEEEELKSKEMTKMFEEESEILRLSEIHARIKEQNVLDDWLSARQLEEDVRLAKANEEMLMRGQEEAKRSMLQYFESTRAAKKRSIVDHYSDLILNDSRNRFQWLALYNYRLLPRKYGRHRPFFEEMHKSLHNIGVTVSYPAFEERLLISKLVKGTIKASHLSVVDKFPKTMFGIILNCLLGLPIYTNHLIQLDFDKYTLECFLLSTGLTFSCCNLMMSPWEQSSSLVDLIIDSDGADHSHRYPRYKWKNIKNSLIQYSITDYYLNDQINLIDISLD